MRSHSQFEKYTHTFARRCAQAVGERADERGGIGQRPWCLNVPGKLPAVAPSPLAPRLDSRSSRGGCLWTRLRTVLAGLLEVAPWVGLAGTS